LGKNVEREGLRLLTVVVGIWRGKSMVDYFDLVH